MCFDASQIIKGIQKEIRRFKASERNISEILNKGKSLEANAENYYHVSAFTHPSVAAFYNKNDQLDLELFSWGLIPHWVETEEKARDIAIKTLNARGETIFEKPSFRYAAEHCRVVVPLDGFYEHHHKKAKKLPYFIRSVDGRRLMVAGIASEWLNGAAEIVKTLSIVTCSANECMTFIHNNPKLKAARMPLILDDEHLNQWIYGTPGEAKSLIRPNTSVDMDYFTVKPVRGKKYIGNYPEIQEKHIYPENYEPPTLFSF